MDISRERLNELISCPKSITPSQKFKFEETNGSRRMNLKLYSEKLDTHYQMRLRQSLIIYHYFNTS